MRHPPPITMVTSGLDEYILQVFEEQEESFYFPITSQNTARNFIKALHTKGVDYEHVYKEIGEFEHNFSAWRKGLGRIGIGNRIIQRINKPLEDVLIEDDEENLQEILTRLKERNTRPGNDRVPHIDKPLEDSRLARIKDHIGRQRDETRERDLRDTMEPREMEVTESKVTASVTNVIESKAPVTRKASNETRPPWKTSDDGDPGSGSSGSPSLSRTSSGRIPGAELEQKEPGVVDFRSVLKRKERTSPPDGAGDRRSMPPSFDEKSKMGIMSGSADLINRIGDRKSWLDERNLKSRAESEPRNVNRAGQTITEHRVTTRTTTEHKDTTDQLKMKSSVLETLKHNEKSHSEEDSDQEFVDCDDELSPTKAPLADQESDSDTNSSVMVSTEEEESSDEKVTHPEKTSDIAEKVTTPDIVIENSDELPLSHDQSPDLNQTNGTDTNGTEGSEEDSEEEDVGENYDSEWDDDNDELNVDGRKIAAHMARHKTETAEQGDGTGYIYVFTDSDYGDLVPRIKIGASRFPHKRLEQALCFNINMRQVSTYSVGQRRHAVQSTRKEMAAYEISGQDGWYQGPLDDMVGTIKRIVEQFPNDTSQC